MILFSLKSPLVCLHEVGLMGWGGGREDRCCMRDIMYSRLCVCVVDMKIFDWLIGFICFVSGEVGRVIGVT